MDTNGLGTGTEIAKMMLVCAGYGAKGEFTGAGWDLNVMVTANKAGIFADVDKTVDMTKAATREEAMLYAFNGLFVPQVEYNKVFDSYVGKGTGIAGGPGDSIAKEVYGYNGEDLDPVFVGGLTKSIVSDVAGRKAYNWTFAVKVRVTFTH